MVPSLHKSVLTPLFQVIQELGREGILPYSSFFASNLPFNAPLCALFSQYLISCLFLFSAPPGDIYQFLISCKPLYSLFLPKLSNGRSVIILLFNHQLRRLTRANATLHISLPIVGLAPIFQGTKNCSDWVFFV
jgi:hypothetical protein